MGRRLATIAIAGVTAAAAFVTLPAQTVKSQWDGVYTGGQASRGDALYEEQCATCHGADLTGSEMAPPLVGGEFAANWNDLTLGDLFERIRISMPQNSPASLSRPEYADVLASILQKGGYPAGAVELPGDTAVLNEIKFLAAKPAQ